MCVSVHGVRVHVCVCMCVSVHGVSVYHQLINCPNMHVQSGRNRNLSLGVSQSLTFLSPSSCDSSFFFLFLDFSRAPPSAMAVEHVHQPHVLFSAHRNLILDPSRAAPHPPFGFSPLKKGASLAVYKCFQLHNKICIIPDAKLFI